MCAEISWPHRLLRADGSEAAVSPPGPQRYSRCLFKAAGVRAGFECVAHRFLDAPASLKIIPRGRPLGDGENGGGCEFRWEGGDVKGRGPEGAGRL